MALKLRKDEYKFVKTLATNYKLVPHLEKAIAQGEFDWEFKYEQKGVDDAWHPSGDCTPSLLDLYLKATGQGEEFDRSGLYKTFMVGHFWHQYLQEVLIRHGLADPEAVEWRMLNGWGLMGTTQAEVRYFEHIEDPILWKPYHWVTGSADVAPCQIPEHGEYVVDFKTMKSMDFRKENPPEWTADKWECQLNIYMDASRLEKALVVGINKDSPHDMKEFEYHRNQDLIDALYGKWKLVSMCLDEGIAPPEDEEYLLPLKGPV